MKKDRTNLGIAAMVLLLIVSVVLVFLYATDSLSLKSGTHPVESEENEYPRVSESDDVPDYTFSDSDDLSDADISEPTADEPADGDEEQTEQTSETTQPEEREGKIKVKTAAFRVDPSVNGKLISYLRRGTKVTIFGKKGSWYHVRYDGKTGWIASKCMEEL